MTVQTTATRVGGWAFLLTGAGHLGLANLLPPSTGDLAGRGAADGRRCASR